MHEHKGAIYYFCSEVCRNRFKEDPKKHRGLVAS
ncbi:MAG: hypothetical protein CEE40_07985 [Chloroflexi bacterium B3_Chlor]|nr:MAG: hypothetical protein CEE40_07985 [Chloroflexi bacterium B3_Chlor]